MVMMLLMLVVNATDRALNNETTRVSGQLYDIFH